MEISAINFNYNNAKSNSTTNNNSEFSFFTPKASEDIPAEIKLMQNITDADIERKKYIIETTPKTYTVKSGDSASSIARAHGISVNYLLAYNSLTGNEILTPGKTTLRIPSTRNAKNISSINDVAKAMGVSANFIKNLKKIEDGKKSDGTLYRENEFHNTPYIDSEGHKTIGIGHVMKKGDRSYLSDKQVLETFTKDLLAAEENLWSVIGKSNYEKLPPPLKEALLDMTFNKGTAILENSEGLVWCLKNGKYEAAINKMTNITSLNGNEMSGLAKRRLFDISVACQMYNGNIPNSNLTTVQHLYNKGIKLLKIECQQKNLPFENILTGYNKDVKAMWGDKIKLITQ